jgi:hypothetical protein
VKIFLRIFHAIFGAMSGKWKIGNVKLWLLLVPQRKEVFKSL